MACVAVHVRAVDRDGGARRIPLSAASIVDPTDADVLRLRCARRWTPAERLWAAVLWEVLADLRKYPPDSEPSRDARRWLESDVVDWPLAFRPLCEQLGLDPLAVRAHVLR